MIIDVHCHSEAFKGPYKNIIPVLTGYSHSSNKKTLALSKTYSIPFVLGIAPQTIIREGFKEEWISFIKNEKPNAIGEIGLDFHWAKDERTREEQKTLFIKMLTLADEMKLPIVIHCRDAHKELYSILRENTPRFGFIMHFFFGDTERATEFIKLGGIISILPKRSKERDDVIRDISLDHIVVESDAPYVMKKIDDVEKAVHYIAEVKEIEVEEVIRKTTENATRFFSIKA